MRLIPTSATLALVTSAFLFISASPTSANCICSGPWQEHTPYPHHFSTASCADPDPDPAGEYIYETCVTNHSDDRYLHFDWLIPGPRSWVPPGVTLPSQRPRPQGSLLRQDGCLRYGNREMLSYAEFLPHIGDRPKLATERFSCANSGIWQDPSVQADDRYNIFVIRGKTLSVFAPTDSARVADTMIRLNAEVTVEPEGDYFWHTVTLRAEPYGTVFQPDRIRVVPEPQELRAAYADQAEDGRLPVSAEGQSFMLQRPMPPVSPQLEDVRFDVFTDAGDSVGYPSCALLAVSSVVCFYRTQ